MGIVKDRFIKDIQERNTERNGNHQVDPLHLPTPK